MTLPPPNFSTDLSGQTALVTGASSGLGRRFALTLAAAGAKVAITARRRERLEQFAAEIEAAGGKATPIELDVTDADQLLAVVAEAEAALGPVTILVNNAGVPDAARATKMPVELIDRVLDTNLRGPYILSCEFARRLMQVMGAPAGSASPHSGRCSTRSSRSGSASGGSAWHTARARRPTACSSTSSTPSRATGGSRWRRRSTGPDRNGSAGSAWSPS